ncbi:MAG: acyl-CoA thioesterase [Deltaproteobacteria bacterium]|nr:acyl-CoA thioesterase [Deltaproteobacteria bacterium]
MSAPERASVAESVVRMRAHYAEVDRMGFLHHSNHLRWFERGREEFCRRRGAVYRELEDAGVLVVVADLEVAYRSPIRYEELADLTVALRAVGHASLVFEYALRRVEDGALAATGRTRHAFVTREGRVTRVGHDVARRLSGPELETRLGELG